MLLLVNLTDNSIYELNATGARAVELIQAGAGRDEVVSSLQEAFLADAGTVAADLDGLIERLETAGLLLCQS